MNAHDVNKNVQTDLFNCTVVACRWGRVKMIEYILELVVLEQDLSFFENTVDPDQLASDEAI